MIYRVISTKNWDGKQSVEYYDSYKDAVKRASYLNMKNTRSNVTIRDEHGIKCSF